jgi:nucleoside-diphosphate-sugar epimerase
MKPNILFFGFGYTAKILIPHLTQAGFTAVGTSRTPSTATLMNTSPIQLFDFHSVDIEKYLSQCSHLLISIPPSQSGNDIVLLNYADLILKYSAQIKWIGYLSSTGVYGNHNGEWVNEHSACNPLGNNAIHRLAAESEWMAYAEKYQLPLHVFRLAGIYGTGRNALARILNEKKHSVYKEGHVFSRIHVEDIANVLMASITSPHSLSIYNVADNEPAPAHLVDEYAATLLGITPLPRVAFSDATMSTMEREFYASNRRVSNMKIKNDLAITLKYPSYREGLKKIWIDEYAHKKMY